MADVGSWVAAELASTLGIPTVLTMARDPHALIASRDAAGTLTRAGFGEVDAAEHLAHPGDLTVALGDRACRVVGEASQNVNRMPSRGKGSRRHGSQASRSGFGLVPLAEESHPHPLRPQGSADNVDDPVDLLIGHGREGRQTGGATERVRRHGEVLRS